jgi:membrane protein DedA with SNARE-associated domain
MFPSVHELVRQYDYAALFVLLLLGIVGLPIPDETLLTWAGFVVRKGHLHPVATFLAAAAGSMGGITLSYVMGRTLGLGLVRRYGHWLHITDERLARFHRWYERAGRWSLTLGYFIPGVRHLTAIGAGTSGIRWPTFALFAYSGALLWVGTFLTIGYFLGREWESGSQTARHGIAAGAVGLALLAVVVYWVRRRGSRPPGGASQIGPLAPGA